MADSRVAARYIKSLLGLAIEKQALQAVHEDMQLFDKTCKQSRDLVTMLRSPMIRHEVKREVLKKMFQGKVNALTMAMIDIITHKNRESLLPQIAADFHGAYNEYKGIGKAQVTTTIPMDAEVRSTIEAIAKKLAGKDQIELDSKVDKDLIGGFVLKVGDKQIDASVKGKLRSLNTKFHEDYHTAK